MAFPFYIMAAYDRWFIYVRDNSTGALNDPVDLATGKLMFNISEDLDNQRCGYATLGMAKDAFNNYPWPESYEDLGDHFPPTGDYIIVPGSTIQIAI